MPNETAAAAVATPAPAPKPVMFKLGDKSLTQEEYDREFAKLAAAARAPSPATKE